MRVQLLKLLFCFILCLVSLIIWCTFSHSNVEAHKSPPTKKSAARPAALCAGCREVIDKVTKLYSQTWKRDDKNYTYFRSELKNKCHGFEKAIITQANTAVGSKLVYDGERKRTLQVTQEIFSTFAKEHPFPNKTWDTCAVVGNGGILANSSCGKTIDSAQFVIRCNLPPLEKGYEKHVGLKTDLVTANPSIFMEKFGSLKGRRRRFVDSLRTYGNSLLLIPAFSFGQSTDVSLRVVYTIEDFESPTRPVFFNPEYLRSLATFWRSKGIRAVRLSSGMIMASMALELCANVHLYGFWPFSNHPYGFRALTNHYYDDRQTKTKIHAMPAEFDLLLRLHRDGVLKLHLEDCQPGEK
uniref:alpha-2,8-sialyltransferase 8F isoform X2 n=1 Tax=Scatophagus argus TaxID=75038 RepID=UPI001ED81129|nr:alpha-2,8-sialyltransferase 8F isoform X2 [Scatophagus argus]